MLAGGVRAATPGDAAAWAEVAAAATPYLVVSAAGVRHEMAFATTTLARLVAERDGTVVGVARARLQGERTTVMVQVRPEYRRDGVGTALLDGVLSRVHPVELAGMVAGDDGSLAAAAAWGFVVDGPHTVSAVDPRTVSAPDLVTRPLSDLDPRTVWRCFAATGDDDPSGLSGAGPFEEFLAAQWQVPTHRPDLGRTTVSADGEVRAFAMVTAAGHYAWSAFTGTRPEARGRGLGRAVKAAALVACADAGITRCGTANDAGNAPMLAVNAALGYAPIATTYAASRPGPG